MFKNLSGTIRIVLIIAITIAIIFVAAIILPWLLIGGSILFSPNPAEPTIKYAEFPFEVVYEINGETKTVNDVFVCEYDGIRMNEGVGKYRTWKGYIKSTGLDAIYICEDNERTIYCFVGDGEYYMNDEIFPEQRPFVPRIYDVPKRSPLEYTEDGFSDINELLEHYKIKIISWQLSDPIENSFSQQ